MKKHPSNLCNVLVDLDRRYLCWSRATHAGALWCQQSGEGAKVVNIPLAFAMVTAGVVFGGFALVLVALDGRRLKRELGRKRD